MVRIQRAKKGTAMLEMVFVMPLLLLLLFGLCEFSVLFGRYQTLNNAAREGARTAVVFRSGCNSATVEAEVRDRVRNYAAPLGMTLADADISVAGVCGSSDTSSSVSATFQHTFTVLQNLAPAISPTIDLVGNSVMRNEGSS